MKKIVRILSLCVLVYSLNSCTEEAILDLTPINNISIDDAFSTPSLIESSMNGVYNAAAIGQYNSTNPNGGRGYVWGAAFIQQGDCRGEDVVNTATFYQATYTATYDTTTANNVYFWGDGYRLINRCNLMIEGVNTAVASGIISQAVADNYIGQSKFLRAITHFELLTHFANTYNATPGASHMGIPYREIGVDTQEEIDIVILKGRNTVADCYSKIIADLDDAELLITNTELTKASKNAAIAYKTKVYLHKRDWDNVIVEGNKLTSYSLGTNDPEIAFDSPYGNTESIFSILHVATNNPGVNAALASQYNRRRLVCISPIIWRETSWLNDDKRRSDNSTSTDSGTGMVFTFSGRKYTNKYRDGVTYTDPAPVIRYAEVALNMAEAYARKTATDLPNALAKLNEVRNRALADVTTQAYTSASFTTPTTMVEAILKERRIEFVMEGKRWGDINRLQGDNLQPINGIPAKVANGNPAASTFTLGTPYTGALGVPSIPVTDLRFLWPIPQVEINNNPTLATQQNPGW